MGSDYCRVWRPNIVVISIHAPRMGSDRLRQFQHKRLQVISIHAPRMGSDAGVQALQRLAAYFNPRSPNGERPLPSPSSTCPSKFQSTLPEWGATTAQHPGEPSHHISIHAPRMGSDDRSSHSPFLRRISIHAPRMGSDRPPHASSAACRDFNPRSPNGERHGLPCGEVVSRFISIHAPRMGSDRENGHLRPRYGQNHPFSTLIVSQIVVDVLGTVRKSQKTPAH